MRLFKTSAANVATLPRTFSHTPERSGWPSGVLGAGPDSGGTNCIAAIMAKSRHGLVFRASDASPAVFNCEVSPFLIKGEPGWLTPPVMQPFIRHAEIRIDPRQKARGIVQEFRGRQSENRVSIRSTNRGIRTADSCRIGVFPYFPSALLRCRALPDSPRSAGSKQRTHTI